MKVNRYDIRMIRQILSEYINSAGTDIMKQYAHHAEVTTYRHAMNVVILSYWFSKKFKINADIKSLVVGAYLHDYYLYDCHQNESRGKFHCIRHPRVALKNAEDDYELNDKEKNIIASHMWPLSITKIPKCKEALIICVADKCCALNEMYSRQKDVS